MEGIKEMKELIEAVMEVGLVIVEEFSDGVQLSDAWSIISRLKDSGRYREAIGKAYDGAGKIPDELKDVDGEEAIDLAMTMLPYLPKILKAAKKKSQGYFKALEIAHEFNPGVGRTFGATMDSVVGV